jgi:4'-phosphopantetheinyl transferase
MKIYLININDVTEKELNHWFDSMSDSRKAEVRNIKNKSKYVSKIISDHICRKSVSEFCGIPENKIVFSKNEYGTPFANGINAHFSVSHSGELVICAVSENEIGIDIEKKREIRPDISKKFATDSENEYIGNDTDRLFEIWTLKEAYFKCIGTGLGADIKNVTFDVDGDKIRCSESGFACSFENLHKDYICSVCIKE